ncbi:MAG TPA: Asp-tRNA(Asn)/Glu-tRNA(Gln) amidotransferase subunit GatC [Phycisphaerales bacterium]|nr:Asp-tRNA(Asn)/Glu-tRNA(Gln) amidotransferase subunit GatC [Phycisphaerales bacterium]
MSGSDSSTHADGLSAEQVRKVAGLAKLELADAEVERLRGELGAILSYAQRLQVVNLDGVEPLATPLELTGPMDDDAPFAGYALTPEALHAMAPATDGPFIKVPKVLGDAAGGGA